MNKNKELIIYLISHKTNQIYLLLLLKQISKQNNQYPTCQNAFQNLTTKNTKKNLIAYTWTRTQDKGKLPKSQALNQQTYFSPKA